MNAHAVGRILSVGRCVRLEILFPKKKEKIEKREKERKKVKKYVFYRCSSVANKIFFLSLFCFYFLRRRKSDISN